MRYVIINADDFGLSPGCNQGIAAAMAAGTVTDTTIFANSAHTGSGVAALRSVGVNAAGLHLNLTWGKPVLAPRAVSSLVGPDGNFRRTAKDSPAGIDPAEAEAEWRAQIERFMALGLSLTHFDSHHHVHAHSPLLAVAIKLAREYGVPLRQTGEAVRKEILAAGVKTTDRFCGDFYGPGATLETLAGVIGSHHEGVLEIMCHPAQPDGLLLKISSYSRWRLQELQILTSRELRDLLAHSGVELIGFAMLRDFGIWKGKAAERLEGTFGVLT